MWFRHHVAHADTHGGDQRHPVGAVLATLGHDEHTDSERRNERHVHGAGVAHRR